MDCIKNNKEIIKRQNNFICTFKMAYNNTCNSINTGYSPFFVRLKKESKIIKYTYTKQHKLSNSVPLQLYNYYFLYKVIYNPTILFIPTNPNSDYALMYGSLASAITGGNFLEGAAIGLIVTALNHALHAALDPDPTQQQKQKSKHVLQYEKENEVELFGSIYEAADDWGNMYNEISIKEGREYGSNLFEVKIEGDNWYGYTSPDKGLPIRNEFGQLSINIITQPPKSSVIVAKIHAHSNGSLEFSTNDFNAVKNNGVPSYITNKAGELRFWAWEKRNPFYIYSKRLNTWFVGEGYIYKLSKYK